MPEKQIRDIDSFQALDTQVKGLKALKRILPFARPLLRLIGVDVQKMQASLAELDKLEAEVNEFINLPDRFNQSFSERGWIFYDLLNVEVARAALKKAEEGDVDQAEQILVDFYSPETVRLKLFAMKGVHAFRPRISLAEKALVDYAEERFHACVPVVLALVDGMINELHEKRRGFFAEGVDLEAWDSVAAHSTGLKALVRVMTRARQTTTTDQITIPYRNGIMHGMDLGYDNKMVAAKSWATLFAARDWALKAERGLLTAPPKTPDIGWRDSLKRIAANAQERDRLNAWQPRALQLGVDVPTTGNADEFMDGSPEQKLAHFLNYWRMKNYGFMANCLSKRALALPSRLPLLIRQIYSTKQLRSYTFLHIEDRAAAVTYIETGLVYKEGGEVIERQYTFTVVNEDANGHGVVRGNPDGLWIVGNWELW